MIITKLSSIGTICLRGFDLLRIRFNLLPCFPGPVSRMGRRAGIFRSRFNPYDPKRGHMEFRYSVNFVMDGPIKITPFDGHTSLSDQAHCFQLAYNQAIWDYHIKRTKTL